MVYPRNPYSAPSVNFFGSSGGGSSKSAAKPHFDPAPHPGFVNLGNTCFLNSVLQALAGTRQFRLLLQGPAEELQDQYGPPASDPNDDADFEWTRRAQSPALWVCDEAHGKASSSTEGMATVKPNRASGLADRLPPSGVDGPPVSPHEPTVIDLPLNTAFRHTLEKLWGSSNNLRGPNINPKQILTILGSKYDQYLEYGQQDGHELMRHLLDACRMEEMDLIKKLHPPRPKKGKTHKPDGVSAIALQPDDVDRGQAIAAPMAISGSDHSVVVAQDDNENDAAASKQRAGEALTARGATQASVPEEARAGAMTAEELSPFLDLLFCGKLASMVVCETCKKVSHTYEDFYDISLSLRGGEGDSRVTKRDRIRSMADRWRRATQGKAVEKTSTSSTPLATPVFSETEVSESEEKKPAKKRGSFLSPQEDAKGRFHHLRKHSLSRRGTEKKRAEKLGATSGSEMEPDFPDMGSLSLAHATRQIVADSAPPSAGEDNGDARTGTRLPRMLALPRNGGDSSSREPSPSGRPLGQIPFPSSSNKAHTTYTPSSQQAAYIARILAEDVAPAQHLNGLSRRPATSSGALSDLVLQGSSAQGRPFHGLHRGLAGLGGARKDALSEFESDPSSPAAKRRRRIQDEQLSTGLVGALRQFTSVEVLDGDNSFACKNCWRLQNPPTARDRERYRRRMARRGLEMRSDDESEPSSSEGGSASENEDEAPASSRAAAKASSDPTTAKGANGPAPVALHTAIPTIEMHVGTPPATDGTEAKQLGAADEPPKRSAPERDEHGPHPPDSVAGVASHASDSNLSSSGYDTGTETDRSGAATSLDSETGIDESEDADVGAGAGAAKHASRAKAKVPKRSTQSLPRRALKRYLIASAPPVLVFHLKRFQATGRGFVSGLAGFKKIDDQVTFPEYLDITPWLAPPREEYDRKSRLKGTSDPLVLRRRAEEEAKRAGLDLGSVEVQLGSRDAMRKRSRHHHDRHHHYHAKAEAGAKAGGKSHSMWSWTAKAAAGSQEAGGANGHGSQTSEMEKGPEVVQGGKAILPSVVQRPRTEYRLYAVVVHQGSLSAGHYTAYVLSDKIRLTGDQRLGLTTTATRSAPPSRVTTPAHLAEKSERRSSVHHPDGAPMPVAAPAPAEGDVQVQHAQGPAPVLVAPRPIAPSLAIEDFSDNEGEGEPRLASGQVGMPLSSGSTSSVDAGSSSQGDQRSVAAVQAEIVRPQTSISSIGSTESGLSQRSVSAAGWLPQPPQPEKAGWSADLLRPGPLNGGGNGMERKSPVPRPGSARTEGVASPAPTADRAKVDDGRRWVYTSDTIVRAASIDEVLKAKAYMLFYERI